MLRRPGYRRCMAQSLQTGTIETQVPARLDRLPWSKFHWRVVVGLGTVWILDGLEVTMVGSVAARLTENGSGIEMSAGQIGIAAAIYVTGACLGALFFGQLTDRFGRKKLFLLTLLVYIVATVATAFAFAPWYFYLARFFTGAGIGGEYAAINSAIDELIPARVRGRVDLVINGSYWLGAAAGAGAALFFLNEAIFPTDIGWRVAFGAGAVLGIAILLVRRHVPESPRWLFIHGREDEAERIVDEIEDDVRVQTGQDLSEPEDTLEVRQRNAIPFRMVADTAFKLYPKRAVLGLALFIGQAFIYNSITFNLGTLLSTFFGVASGVVPIFIIIWAFSNFLGPVLLGRLFDTLGRIPMISGTYLGSALLTAVLAGFMFTGALDRWTFLAFIVAIFFLASAGASAAYLTVSEVFPMETRALAIAFFYAVGTAVGGITGPLLFGQLIGTGVVTNVAVAFLIGAAVMAVGGAAELVLGVRAEKANLEDIAKPLTAKEAEEGPEATDAEERGEAGSPGKPRTQQERDHESHLSEAQMQARRRRAEGEQRIGERTARQSGRESTGLRRFRPGPSGALSSGRTGGIDPARASGTARVLDQEIEIIERALSEHGPVARAELARLVGARYWGPGRFAAALNAALEEDRARAVSRRTYAPGDRADDTD